MVRFFIISLFVFACNIPNKEWNKENPSLRLPESALCAGSQTFLLNTSDYLIEIDLEGQIGIENIKIPQDILLSMGCESLYFLPKNIYTKEEKIPFLWEVMTKEEMRIACVDNFLCAVGFSKNLFSVELKKNKENKFRCYCSNE